MKDLERRRKKTEKMQFSCCERCFKRQKRTGKYGFLLRHWPEVPYKAGWGRGITLCVPFSHGFHEKSCGQCCLFPGQADKAVPSARWWRVAFTWAVPSPEVPTGRASFQLELWGIYLRGKSLDFRQAFFHTWEENQLMLKAILWILFPRDSAQQGGCSEPS